MAFKRSVVHLSLLLLSTKAYCQMLAPTNYGFILHLTENNKNREALYLLDQPSGFNADTLSYLKGINYYLLKKTDSAALYLNAVSRGSGFYIKSRFFATLNLSYSKKYREALAGFADIDSDTVQKFKQLINLLKAGNYLLLRDYKNFDSVSSGFLYDDYRYVNEQRRLTELKSEAIKSKKKSPFLAGTLSAIVPGLGKFYVGKRGAALAAFGASAALAAITLETYYRSEQNAASPQFIAFGTLFTFFYVGNIVGSVYSVKQQIKSLNGRINNETLANMHLALVHFLE